MGEKVYGDSSYEKDKSFWIKKGDKLTVMGDLLGRMPAIKILEPVKGENILDAGCGAGFISRRLAKLGAKVWGCDRNENMLNQAIKEEKENPFGIEYELSDITKMPYKSEFFDTVMCIGVLMYLSPEGCSNFLSEAHRILKKSGRVLISLNAPELFPNQIRGAKGVNKNDWVTYNKLENKPLGEDQIFKENYRDSQGKIFESELWSHSEKGLINSFENLGFEIKSVHKNYITKQSLEITGQRGKTGFPAFLQIEAIKA